MLNLINFAVLLLLLNGCAKSETNSTSTPPTSSSTPPTPSSTPPTSSSTPPSIQSPPPATDCKDLSENECLLRADCKFHDGKCHTKVKNTLEQAKNAEGDKEAERLEQDKKPKEEAEKKAQEEAAKLAQEEAEKKAKEEAEKKAQEEAEKKAQEEAAKLAKEEAEKKAKEEAEKKAQEEAEKKAQEEAAKLAKEEAEKKAKEEAKSKDGIIKQINSDADKDKLAQNITEFLNSNHSDDDIKEITNILATKEASYIKDVNAKLTAEHKLKIRPHLKDALTKTKSEFKADVILDLGILNFRHDEEKKLKTEGYVSNVDYVKTTFGDMLIKKRIKDTLDNFNTNLKSKYDDFKKTFNIEGKSEEYNKERFYHLLRTKKIDNGYFINNLINLPTSDASYTMLKDLLDNTQNPKEFLSSTQSLLLDLTKTRKFTQFKYETKNLAENENEKIKMIGLLLDKGGLSLIKEEDFKNLLPIIKDNKLNIDDLITNSTEKELENFATIFAKANYSDESNAIAANNLLNKILENKNITTQIKKDILVNLLSNNNKKFIDAMPTNLINNNALIDGVSNNGNIALLSNYIVAKNDLINLIKDDKNKKTQVELLNYLSANDANNNLDLFEKLLENTNFTADELKNSLSNLCDEKWHKKITYIDHAYNNQKRIELMKNLILSNAEIPKDIADEDVKNILESSKKNKQILEILFKNDKFLDTFLSYTTDKLKTDASYEALKSNIINASTSKFLNKALSSKSIADDKKNELFSLLLENGANLNEITDNKIFAEKLKLVPDDKMKNILISLTGDDKISIAVKYAVENLKADFRDGLLVLTNKSNVARDAVIETALNRNINELVDLINNPENYGLAKEQITKTDYYLIKIKFNINFNINSVYEPIKTHGSLLMYLFSKMINKDKNLKQIDDIKNIVLALKNYFNKEEWLKYLTQIDYEKDQSGPYNFMRFIKEISYDKNKEGYFKFITDIDAYTDTFSKENETQLLALVESFKNKTKNKMELLINFYLKVVLLLNKDAFSGMETYANSLNEELKKEFANIRQGLF
jgi:TolA protein